MKDHKPHLLRPAIAIVCAVLLTTGCGIIDVFSGRPDPGPSLGQPPPTTNSAEADTVTDPPTPSPPSATPAPAVSWPELVKENKTGVARISVTVCDNVGVGSGFLVDETHIATAAHVVTGAAGITVGVNGQVVTATIVGMDENEDVALLKTDTPLTGHQFTFTAEDPAEGTEVGVLGYPLGENFTFDSGRINGLNRQNGPGFKGVGHILQTNTVINGGNSGGPLVTLDGNVVGIVRSTRIGFFNNGELVKHDFEGTNYVNSGAFAKTLVEAWLESPAPVPLEICDATALPTNNQISVKVDTPDERGMQVAQSLLIHAQAINGGAYGLAYLVFTPQARLQQKGVALWSQEMNTSYWHSIEISDITSTGNGSITANVSFNSTQDAEKGPDGQSCSIWHMQYSMVWATVWWEISEAKATMPAEPCPAGP